MTTLTVYRGLPASGKTTLARAWVAEDLTRRARVNRDDFRVMCHDGTFIKGATEKQILTARDGAIRGLLRLDIDVVCDDTNLPSRVVRDLRRLAVKARAGFEVIDLTDVDIDTCLARDRARPRPVGDEVIVDMYQRFVKGKPHPLPIPDEPSGPTLEPYEPKPDAPQAVLVDIDGTVALMCARSPYDETRVHEDRPNRPVIEAVRAMWLQGHDVVFTSARTEACKDATEAWLNEHWGTGFAGLYMRAEGDMRKDAVVKAELFDRHIRDRWNVTAVFDDRRQVVDMWRDLGLTVFHVAEGDF